MFPGTPAPGPSDHQATASASGGTSIAPSSSIPTGKTGASTLRLGIFNSTGAAPPAGGTARSGAWGGADPSGSSARAIVGARQNRVTASMRSLGAMIDPPGRVARQYSRPERSRARCSPEADAGRPEGAAADARAADRRAG